VPVSGEANASSDRVVERQRDVRERARRLLGVGADAVGLDDGIRRGIGWYALVALSLFVFVDEIAGFIINVVGPDVSRTLGVAPRVFSTVINQRNTFVGLAAMQVAWATHRKPRRAALAASQAQSEALTLVTCSLMTWTGAFLPLMGSIGGAGGVIYTTHRSLILDGYPPPVRVRALALHRGGAVVGLVAAPALVCVLSGAFDLSWRGVFIYSGLLTLVAALVGRRVPDAGFGRFDAAKVRQLVRAQEKEPEGELLDDDPGLNFTETLRRIWLIPTVRRLLAAWAVLGIVLAPLVTYLFFFLQERFGYSLGPRAAFFGAAWALSLPVLVWFGRKGEALFRQGPAALTALCGRVMFVLAAGLVVAVIPNVVTCFVGFATVFACSSVLIPALSMVLLSIVRPRSRPVAGALSGFFFAMVGAEGGTFLMGGIDQRFSTAVAIAVLAIPALLTAGLLRRASGTVDDDLDNMLDEVVEQEELASLARRGVHLPLMTCRHIDFSYGDVQVLFDVDFTVDDGEMVALLGTNGAGKSTLLRVISGLGYPTRGSVAYEGQDITFSDADRRVAMGISQVPGGRAVFGSLSVIDNLRVLGYSLGRNRAALDRGIDAAFAALPQLAARPDQPAATLSGGEQQMLGLAKAFIVQPRILLIDELSLGLAPKIVSELLDTVKEINRQGTAVVLVEQSVNIALAVVNHAYFMEKGEIRFDGPAADLLDRRDLLRSIFLDGATRSALPGRRTRDSKPK
jgi:ABC-type branched-subunit amino acid transport system ATPase component/MFS family permease